MIIIQRTNGIFNRRFDSTSFANRLKHNCEPFVSAVAVRFGEQIVAPNWEIIIFEFFVWKMPYYFDVKWCSPIWILHTHFYLLKKHGIRSRSKGPCKRYMIKWKYACEQPIHYFCSTSPNETSSARFFLQSKMEASKTFGRMTVSRACRRRSMGSASLHLTLQSVLEKLSPFL